MNRLRSLHAEEAAVWAVCLFAFGGRGGVFLFLGDQQVWSFGVKRVKELYNSSRPGD